MASKMTVLIPCKNERMNIRPCIESIREIADEILVADSESTDGTLSIVHQMGGCRVIEREYVHSADFKNWAIPQASHEWVLLLDADERVTEELRQEIRQTLVSPDDQIDAYWIGRDNHYLGFRIKHCGWKTDGVRRLFRRDVTRYRPRWVHAAIEVDDRRVRRLSHHMLHYTTWSTEQYFEKLNRYATWGALNLKDESRKPNTLAMFLTGPLRFLHLYFMRGGILDGVPGFQVCMFAAFYSFLKKAKLWEIHNAIPQPDPEANRDVSETTTFGVHQPGGPHPVATNRENQHRHAA